MGFWSDLFNRSPQGITANSNVPAPAPGTVGPPDWNPGDPDGVELVGFDKTESRSLRVVHPSPWSGWPANWNVPNWDFGSRFNELVDIAWACLDLNSSVLSSMPVYRTRSGVIVEPSTWMTNPDPSIYSSWHEFAKQLFWDFQLGEAFVLPMSSFTDGFPMRFRVIPPWLVKVEMRSGVRTYQLGTSGPDVTSEILHVRYKSTTDSPRGVGPLESAGGRMLTAGILATYIREIVSTGGVPAYTLETEDALDADEAEDLLHQWVASRAAHLGTPAVLDSGATLKTHQAMSPKDMAMLELAQFTEGRIANLLGVPPFLVGLPTGGDSMTYSNVSSLFDFHDRASLRPKAATVMAALSNWSLPPGQAAELNRDEYTRPAFTERATAWVALKQADLVTTEQYQAAERLMGTSSAAALTGANGSSNGSNRSADTPSPTPREIAEMIQKIYLGVGVVISADEARAILNRAGAGLNGTFEPVLTPNGR